MSKIKDMARLSALAGMLRDIELAEVSAAAQARQASLDRLADLALPRQTAEVDEISAARAGLLYESWADQRRAEIRLVLERQTKALLQAQDKARLALGRADVMERLTTGRR